MITSQQTRSGRVLRLTVAGGMCFVDRRTNEYQPNDYGADLERLYTVGHCVRWYGGATEFEAESRDGDTRRFDRLWKAVRWQCRLMARPVRRFPLWA